MASSDTSPNVSGGRIFPDWSQLETLRQKLTDGERTLARNLDVNLPPDWEIFVQPFLNGDRPDIVILYKERGVVIFEVKDWSPGLYRVGGDSEGGAGNLRSGQMKNQYQVNTGNKWQEIASPVSQVRRYRDNLINLYVPDIGQSVAEHQKLLSLFKAAVYMHNMSRAKSEELFPNRHYWYLLSSEDLDAGANTIKKYIPNLFSSSIALEPSWYDAIRSWLQPPLHSIEQGSEWKLTTAQRHAANQSPGQRIRLRGSAGSGKSLVLAHRASMLAAAGKSVLVVTFNITLWHYIRDLVSRTRQKFSWEMITFIHFHGFCRNYLSENGVLWPRLEVQDKLEREKFFKEEIPHLVTKIFRSGLNQKDRKYDAILIDEGQDYYEEWYKMLLDFLVPNGQVLFVADTRQNIYRRSAAWVEGPMSGFKGKWRELNECYRLRPQFVELANQFSMEFLSRSDAPLLKVPADRPPDLFDVNLIWKEVDDNAEMISEVIACVLWLMHIKKYHPSDIVVLVSTHDEGWMYVRAFEQLGMRVNHVFEDENKNHYHKMCFWMGSPRLKISTIHSFKGWELENVIVVTPEADVDGLTYDIAALLYTSMTRTLRNLVVYNRLSRFARYGARWPENEEFYQKPPLADLLPAHDIDFASIVKHQNTVYYKYEEALDVASRFGGDPRPVAQWWMALETRECCGIQSFR